MTNKSGNKPTNIGSSLAHFQSCFRTVFTRTDRVALVAALAIGMKTSRESSDMRKDVEICLSKVLMAMSDEEREISLTHLKLWDIELSLEITGNRQVVKLHNHTEENCKEPSEEVLH